MEYLPGDSLQAHQESARNSRCNDSVTSDWTYAYNVPNHFQEPCSFFSLELHLLLLPARLPLEEILYLNDTYAAYQSTAHCRGKSAKSLRLGLYFSSWSSGSDSSARTMIFLDRSTITYITGGLVQRKGLCRSEGLAAVGRRDAGSHHNEKRRSLRAQCVVPVGTNDKNLRESLSSQR